MEKFKLVIPAYGVCAQNALNTEIVEVKIAGNIWCSSTLILLITCSVFSLVPPVFLAVHSLISYP